MSPKSFYRLTLTVFLLGYLNTIALAQPDSRSSHAYVSLTAQWLPDVHTRDSTVTLAPGASAIRLPARFDPSPGRALSLTIGRQFDRNDTESRARAWRLESELWSGTLDRQGFTVGALAAGLSDSSKAVVLFFNGVSRLMRQEDASIWIGAGVGYAELDMPSAVTQATCSCLGKAEGRGVSYQVKLDYERLLSPKTAWTAGIGYVWLPASATDRQVAAYAEHGRISGAAIRLGVIHSF